MFLTQLTAKTGTSPSQFPRPRQEKETATTIYISSDPGGAAGPKIQMPMRLPAQKITTPENVSGEFLENDSRFAAPRGFIRVQRSQQVQHPGRRQKPRTIVAVGMGNIRAVFLERPGDEIT